MTKKRRTRAQKIRAQQRHHDIPQIKTAPAPAEPVMPTAKPVAEISEQPAPTRLSKQTSDLRLSLVIFGVLIALQLGLWLVFKLTTLDSLLPGNLQI